MRVVFAAGGTGGHIIPAIAVADALRDSHPQAEILFVGVGKPLEQRLVPSAGYKLETLSFHPLLGTGGYGKVKLLFSFPPALYRAVSLFRALRPDVVIGFGGYPSILPMVAARLLGIPTILHEQNQRVGVANRILARLADRLFAVSGATGFPDPTRVRFMPLPVRSSFTAIPSWHHLGDGGVRLAVIGGSQGAVTLSSAILQLIPFFQERNFSLIHQTGTNDLERVRAGYDAAEFTKADVRAFLEQPSEVYSWADIVVSRAGAMSVAELCAAGRLAIYVPLPLAGGHQYENCRYVVEGGGALSVAQDEKLPQLLEQELRNLIDHPERIAEMAGRARTFSGAGAESPTTALVNAIVESARRP